MEFVAQLVEHQIVALVVAGSKPVKLPLKVVTSHKQTLRYGENTGKPNTCCFSSSDLVF